jgi:hypothetical protein
MKINGVTFSNLDLDVWYGAEQGDENAVRIIANDRSLFQRIVRVFTLALTRKEKQNLYNKITGKE